MALLNLYDIADLPRERFLAYGGERVSNAELLALILGTGTRGRNVLELAEHLLHALGGLPQLARAAPSELLEVPGIGAARASRVAATFHLGRRALEASAAAPVVVRNPRDLYERLRLRLRGLSQEVFLVIALDPRNVIIEEIEVARGCLTGVDVHPREVFRPLIRRGAAAAVVAHNHPSGDPAPSAEDIALTRRLCEAGDLLGIPLLDHLVLGACNCASVFELLGMR
ncbi:RadC family protein [Haliangium ochraceum]|uniref:DNA repair protein RadC n=1 Tax=Haliangium ochraceum (strain DSM 14365 / JCM 11303 / SMP-2) TaxID=502025 RepID=D0LGP2_HALO1|nr:DNA repair protein RadC [Haliangium ochraceum]ACY12788.1 DNA repair protein RadC [Haliangium ochraceum DSM 14365]